METRDMVRMANQIASFFASYPHEEAVQGTADHVNKFWEPRMRSQLLAYLAKGGDGLAPLVKDAAAQIHKPKSEVA
jgi:formate dehydrogenase subunit delta